MNQEFDEQMVDDKVVIVEGDHPVVSEADLILKRVSVLESRVEVTRRWVVFGVMIMMFIFMVGSFIAAFTKLIDFKTAMVVFATTFTSVFFPMYMLFGRHYFHDQK